MSDTGKHIQSLGLLVMFVALAFGSSDSRTPQQTAQDQEQRAQRQCEDKITAFLMSQDFVKKQLKAPATADFPRFTNEDVHVNYLGDCTHDVVAYVDAQNSFGAKIRSNYHVKLRNEKGTDTWTAIEVQVVGR
jgi:GTP1/Obg family GTP-binding protein